MYKIQPQKIQEKSYKNIANLPDQRVIIRSCLNVTVDKDGRVTDATRLNESLPLIQELAGKAQNLVIMAHLGRPKERSQDTSFWHLAQLLGVELEKQGVSLKLISDLTDSALEEIKNNQDSKQVFLLENIRYFEGEDSKDAAHRFAFANTLASLGTVFINDAFADYRESASSYDIAKLLPSFLGPVFIREVEALSKFNNPEKPFIAVLGGAKLSEKLDALKSLLEIADKVIVGGAMAYTLLKAEGKEIGNSLFELDKLEVAKEIISKYKSKLVLPVDHLVCDIFNEESALNSIVIDQQEIPNGKIAIDLGPDSIALFKDELSKAKSILWNGPMGVSEWEVSSKGTTAMGSAISSNLDAYILAGGGDSIAAINKFGLTGFDHVSTGGGAMLAFLAYDKFPILDVIVEK